MHSMRSSGSGGMAEFKDLLATLSDPKKFQERIEALESKHSAAHEADKVSNEKILLAKELEASLKVKQEDLETLQLKLNEKEKHLAEIEHAFSEREIKVSRMEKEVSAKKLALDIFVASSSEDLSRQQSLASKKMIEAQAMLEEAQALKKESDHRMARMKAALT